MKLGLGRRGLSFGGSGGPPKPVTDYFNGFELSGSTYSGGPTVVPDNTGALVTSPSNVLPLEGMRLATTVADGAVLGPELFTGNLTTGAGITVTGNDATHIVSFSAAGMRYQSDTTSPVLTVTVAMLLTVGKQYQFAWNYTGTGGLKTDSVLGGTNITSNTPKEIAANSTSFTLLRATTNVDVTVSSISVREVIPTWLPTTSLGAQIHPSTPLRTRKGTVSVYGEDFRGPLIEPARTNLLLYSNDFSNATWQKLQAGDGVAAVVTAGFTDPNGGNTAFRVQLNAGSNRSGDYSFLRQIGGALTGLSSPVARSLWIKSNTGANQVVAIVATSSATKITATTAWQRIELLSSSGVSQFDISVGGAAGTPATADVIVWCAQHESGAFCSSYIPTAATTVTRDAKNLTRPTAGTALAALNNWGIRLRFRPTAAGQTAVLWGSYTDANNSTRIDLAASTLTYTKRLAGSNHVAQASLTHAAATLYDVIIYQHSVSGMGIAFRSWNGSAWSAWSAWATLTDANGIANATIASTYQWGALNNASHVSANMPFCHVFALNPALNPQTQIADLLAKGRI